MLSKFVFERRQARNVYSSTVSKIQAPKPNALIPLPHKRDLQCVGYKHSAPSEPWRCFPLSDDLTTKSASELLALIRARTASPVEVVEAHLRRIEELNPSLNAIVTIADDVTDRARLCESEVTSGKAIGPLHGLPLTIKDTIDTAGLRTTAGSRIFAERIPRHDATVVARLKAAGAIVLGKTNVPEMAIPYETNNPVFGRANNPYNALMTPGGSSGGEAAAIAACMSAAGIGSELSGSIRVPAHFCGIAGLKPTTGRVPMNGHTPTATGVMSLGACVGPMARTVKDLVMLFNVLANATTSEVDNALDASTVRGMRVACYFDDGVAIISEEIRAALTSASEALADAGLEILEAIPPGIREGSKLWIDLFSRAANSEIASLYRGREDEAGPQVAALLRHRDEEPSDFGDRIETAEHLAGAVLERERLREELLHWMRLTPLILAPVGATTAFEHGRDRVNIDGTYVSVFRAFSYSQTFNVFGLPAVAVPAGRTAGGLPIGVQIVGRPNEEATVLSTAAIIEAALGGWQRPAGVFL